MLSPGKRLWHTLSVAETAAALDVSASVGLSTEEAQQRLLKYGPNEIAAERGRSLAAMVVSQFNDVLIWMLLAATVISLVIGDRTDALVILAIVVLNAVLGVVQEFRAEQSLDALNRMSAPSARVLRGGEPAEVPSREVVPGDVLLLEAGNLVSADARVMEASRLLVDEAILTGESEPVEKSAGDLAATDAPLGDRYGILFSDTAIVGGRATAIAFATGSQTQVGWIAAQLAGTKPDQTPLQGKLAVLGKWLAVGVLAACVVVFVAGLLRGEPPAAMFLTAVSLAVAAIPEGLPAVVTIVLAVGTRNMARRNALVRRLQAVETLGATTVICTDKTGTLTQNQMTVRRWWTPRASGDVDGTGYSPTGAVREGEGTVSLAERPDVQWLMQAAVACNDAELVSGDAGWVVRGDPTEGALLAAGAKAGIAKADMNRDWPRIAEAPFDSERKRMTTVHTVNGANVAIVKGAPDEVRPRCTRVLTDDADLELTEERAAAIRAAGLSMANSALRVLGLAFRRLPAGPIPDDVQSLENDLTFIGLLGMMDSPRPEAAGAIAACVDAGIRPVMITGDHPVTASAIAREIGLASSGVMTGREIAAASETELAEAVRTKSVFARVSPEDKLRLVGALKKAGEVVAMTGDGVNDAPALKRADIGVAMGLSGTDVAKGASDMVLTDDNFATIVAAVEEGRTVFANIRKAVFYLLSCNLSEVLTLFLALMVGWRPPLMAVQILWVNLVTDGLPALALGVDPGEKDSMKRPPRQPGEGVFTRQAVADLLLYGAFMTAAVLTAYAFVSNDHPGADGLKTAQTAAFLTISFTQLVHALNCRSLEASLFRVGLFTNPQLVGAVVVSGVVQLAAVYLPWGHRVFRTVSLAGADLAVVVCLSLSPIIVGEVLKAVRRARRPA